MTAKATAGQAAQSPPLGGLAASWDDRCAHLRDLMRELAEARDVEMTAYSAAFTGAVGPVEAKHQVARAATAGPHLRAEYAAAEVAAYQVRIQAWLAEERPTP